jgi:hypothetical protein
MYAASSQFAAALAGSHERVTTADVYYGGRLVLSSLPITAGRVTLDLSQDVNGTLTLEAASPDGALVPHVYADALAPYGSEVAIRTGVRYPDGSIETLAYGRYVLTTMDAETSWSYSPATTKTAAQWANRGAQIALAAEDRMMLVRRAALLNKITPPATAKIVDELKSLVSGYVPIRQLPQTVITVPNDIVYNSEAGSRLAAIKAIVPDDWTFWIDRDGSFNAVINPTTTPAPVATYTVGPSGNIIRVAATMTSENVFNAVIARGQNEVDLGTIKGEAYLGGGPAAWNGPFGQAPTFMGGLLMATKAELDAAAQTRLRGIWAGRDRIVTADLPPDPRLDLNDVITLTLPDMTFTGRVVRIDYPLTADGGSMAITLKVAENAVIYSRQPTTGGIGG